MVSFMQILLNLDTCVNNLQNKFNNCFYCDFTGHFKVTLVQICEIKIFCWFLSQLLLHNCTNEIPKVEILFIICYFHK